MDESVQDDLHVERSGNVSVKESGSPACPDQGAPVGVIHVDNEGQSRPSSASEISEASGSNGDTDLCIPKNASYGTFSEDGKNGWTGLTDHIDNVRGDDGDNVNDDVEPGEPGYCDTPTRNGTPDGGEHLSQLQDSIEAKIVSENEVDQMPVGNKELDNSLLAPACPVENGSQRTVDLIDVELRSQEELFSDNEDCIHSKLPGPVKYSKHSVDMNNGDLSNGSERGKYEGIQHLFVGDLRTGPKIKSFQVNEELNSEKTCEAGDDYAHRTFQIDTVNSALGNGRVSVSGDGQLDLLQDDTGGAVDDTPMHSENAGEDTKNRENVPLANAEEGQSPYGQMELYEDDFSERGKLSQILARIGNYQAGIAPDPNDLENSAKKPKSAKLGLLMGVYLPCIQNIFGVILFIRLTWLVGNAGLVESFFIVLICCLTTMLTAISMSAIATNGVVPGGGSYFMISRALGPEFGGAVGVLFYLGTSVASSMYIIGAVEILVTYIAPAISLFGDITITENAFNNFRVYGTCLLIILIACVFVGVRFVSKFAPVSLFCVILSILAIYVGIFAASPSRSVSTCLLGNRLLASDSVMKDGVFRCDKNETGPIYHAYCGGPNVTLKDCDPYFQANNVTEEPGIPGLASGIVKDNIANHYSEAGMIPGGSDTPADRSRGEIMADITASFTVLIAIFFPSVTGIMAGSNRSGDLADAQKSIPIGTICAIATTSIVYLTCVLFFAGTITGELMRDKFGESIGGGLVVANLAWPHPYVILIGSLLSTVGAGLQSLTGAPRLLQAIAQDGVIPFLNVFSVTTKKGEPMRAILLTAAISEIGILIASLDYVAPIITMFFLMCYGFVNMACCLQTLLRTPNWRPRFRFYHWTLSLLGMALCIALMFISSWYYALVAIAVAICIYKYIEYKGAEKEWGDGIRGLAMSAARYALLNLEQGPPHTKNWRPQLLVLMKLDSSLQPKFTRMVTFAGQLKAGKGLTMLASVLKGHHKDRFADAQAAKQTMNKVIEETGVKAFADVLVAKSVTDGLCDIIQTAGLGGLKHNTVIVGWPYGWRHNPDVRSYRVFLDTVKNVIYCQHCLLVVKGAEMFPDSGQKLSGTIDVWWIVHEGGLLMLLPFLLRQHKTWKNCRLRIFTVAQLEDNSIQMKKDLDHYLYQLRIEAEVAVVEMSEGDISAYTYERTLMMEQRTEMLKEMRIKERKEAQTIMDKAHTPTRRNIIPTIKLDAVPEDTEETDTDDPIKSEDMMAEPVTVSDINQFTFSPQNYSTSSVGKDFTNLKPSDKNVRRMHTAVRLNEAIVEKSHTAQLVILNMPAPPKAESGEENYMEYLEVLTEGLERVLMVRGSGREVITIYS